MHQHDDHDDLAALDFSSYESPADDDGVAESDVAALYEYAPPEPEDAGSELDAIHSATQTSAAAQVDADEEDGLQLFTVTNPPETVSVSALMDGRTQRVRLSPTATNMTESELADEILVLAGLARQQGLAGQHTFLLENETVAENLHEIGIADNEILRGLIDNVMHLPTQDQADAAQAEVFATRYTTDK
jgi:ESX secretion-associated protein EspD/H